MSRLSRYTGTAVNLKNLTNIGILTARGDVPGVDDLRKFGKRTVGTTYEDIWEGTANTVPTKTTALAVRIRSGGNAADDASGAGAQEIEVQGVDENWDFASETITTAGAAQSSATTTTFLRIYRAFVTKVGTSGSNNTGTIIIEYTDGVEATNIQAGNGQTLHTHFTVSDNQVLFVTGIIVTAAATKVASVRLFKRENLDDTVTPFTNSQRLQLELTGFTDEVNYSFPIPIKVTGPADIWMRGLVSTGTGSMTAEFNGYIIDVDGYNQLGDSRTNE